MTASTDNWIPFTNCSIQVAKLPVRIFEQPNQQRKKHHSAEKRYTLLVKLSAYADADGGNCYPGDEELIKVLGWSRSHIIRVRGELEASNFVLADGLVRRPGSRVPKAKKWRLVLPPTAQSALGLADTEPQNPQAPQVPDAGTQKADEIVKRVWDYYIQKLGKNPKLLSLTVVRKKKGEARLREAMQKTGDPVRAEKILLLSVDALASSAFHRGDNDRKTPYDSWENNLFKSQEQFEMWLERT